MSEKGFSKEDINIGGSVFWIILILISIMGLSYLMIWSFHNNSVKGAVISTIFITMILSGIILSRMKVFDMSSWEDNALSFALGFSIWSFLGTMFSSQSTLSVSIPKNYLLATISSELPVFTEMIINNFIVPVSEELFWMVGIPFAILSVMKQLGKKYEFCNNEYLQMGIMIIIAGSTFAYFHIGKTFTAFIISAIIFRTIMIVMVYGDYKFDMLKGINLVSGFAVGSHIANNILDTGFQKTWTILSTNIPVTIIIVVFFGAIFLTAINRILMFVVGKSKNLEGD